MHKNKLAIMVLVICALISITLGILLYIDNREPSPSPDEVDKTDTDVVNFDYEALEDELVKLIETDENTKAYISTCKDNGLDENNNPKLDIDNKEMKIKYFISHKDGEIINFIKDTVSKTIA